MEITLATHIYRNIKILHTVRIDFFLLLSVILFYLFFWLQLVLNMEDILILC